MTQTISAQAAALGLSADTLRYYERLGLMPPSPRTAAGYRLYGEEAADRLSFISGAKRMGLRLADWPHDPHGRAWPGTEARRSCVVGTR
jgi:DNA-binding transcriptional MerR regulator